MTEGIIQKRKKKKKKKSLQRGCFSLFTFFQHVFALILDRQHILGRNVATWELMGACYCPKDVTGNYAKQVEQFFFNLISAIVSKESRKFVHCASAWRECRCGIEAV